jgi:hypothetical protein
VPVLEHVEMQQPQGVVDELRRHDAAGDLEALAVQWGLHRG